MELHAVKSWYDLKKGRVIEVEDDVQNIVREIREVSDRLHVFYNDQKDEFDVVESCLDGTDRLVFTTKQLTKKAVDRVRLADHWRGQERPTHVLRDDEDFASEMDKANDALEAAKDEAFREKIRDAGERLHWALDIGPGQHSAGGQILISPDVKRHRTRFK
jgi:hypothetical protein